jgi:RNA polymerase sigma-70 factor (ECF subfamily)
VSDDDRQLLDLVTAGDEAAFAALVRRYSPRLLRLAETIVPTRAVAEEVVQDTWLGVVRGVHRFEGRSSFKTWLFRILVNRARSTARKEPRTASLDASRADVLEDRFDAHGAWRQPPVQWSDEVDDRIVAERLAARVKESLGGLPEAQRRVVLLRDVEGLTAAETCELLGINDGHQRVLLHRGRAQVRTVLEAEMGRV